MSRTGGAEGGGGGTDGPEHGSRGTPGGASRGATEGASGQAAEGASHGPPEPVGRPHLTSDVPRPGWVRRLYEWVLHWAETPHGERVLFGLSFAESSFFPIPPDPLLMALCLGAPKKSLRFALVTTVASVVGGLVGYAIGAGAWHVMADWFYQWVPGVGPEAFAEVQDLYERYDFWAVFLAGLTPIPYKVFTLSSGIFGINLGIFVVASVASRGLRFFAVATLIYRYGPPVSRFIDRYFNLLTWVFAILLVLGFMLVEVVL